MGTDLAGIARAPIFFEHNRVARVYSGGKLFHDFFGDADEDGPVIGSGSGAGVRPGSQTSPLFGHTVRMGQTTVKPSSGARPVLQLKVGDKVRHATLGEGTVVGLEGMGQGTTARITFDGHMKRLLLRMAPLEKI